MNPWLMRYGIDKTGVVVLTAGSLATDGTDPHSLIDDLGTLPDGITIDRDHNHLYWTNMGNSFTVLIGFIERIDLPHGHNRTVVDPAGTLGVHTPNCTVLVRS